MPCCAIATDNLITVRNRRMSMVKKQDYRFLGFVTDICDSIVSVTGLTHAFCGELVRFNSIHGDITGFV
jgi:F0F1-type ATP synthase alpha subunit